MAVSEEQRAAVALVRHLIWWLYRDLKLYRADPAPRAKAGLKARFDRLFGRTTGFAELDAALARLKLRKTEMLVALERPEVPLNTNSSEQDIRDPVTVRKISGGTRRGPSRLWGWRIDQGMSGREFHRLGIRNGVGVAPGGERGRGFVGQHRCAGDRASR